MYNHSLFYYQKSVLLNNNFMILLLAFTLLLQSYYACPDHCDSCAYSACDSCSSGYIPSNDSLTCVTDYFMPIFFSLFFGLPVFIFFAFLCYKCCSNSESPNNQVGVTETNINRNPSVNSKKWQNIQSDEQQFRHWQVCNICLNQQLNVKTLCGHRFHLICIGGWFKMSPTCTTCRAEINNIVIFCNMCYQRCKKLSLRDVINIHQQAIICNVCIEGLT